MMTSPLGLRQRKDKDGMLCFYISEMKPTSLRESQLVEGTDFVYTADFFVPCISQRLLAMNTHGLKANLRSPQLTPQTLSFLAALSLGWGGIGKSQISQKSRLNSSMSPAAVPLTFLSLAACVICLNAAPLPFQVREHLLIELL
jgi:hypothetical protein